MRLPTVPGRLVAKILAIVAQDMRDAQPIVGEDLAPAARLRGPVAGQGAPCPNAILVAEEGERQQLSRIGERLEALDRDEAVDQFDIGFQRRGETEIFVRTA